MQFLLEPEELIFPEEPGDQETECNPVFCPFLRFCWPENISLYSIDI